MSIACGAQNEKLKYFCMVRTKTTLSFQILSHLAKGASLCYIITRKGNQKFHFPLSPDRTSERSNMGSALQAQNIQEDNSHFVYPTFGSIVKTITSCALEKMVPLARQCSEIRRKRGNQDVRY